MDKSTWKFPKLPLVLQQQLELPSVLSALRSGQPLSQEDREVLIALIERQLTPAAEKQAADSDKKMWLYWRLAFLDLLAGKQKARRKNIAAAFPAATKVNATTVKNARTHFDAEVTAYRDIAASNEALLAMGAEYIDSLHWDFGADEQRLLEAINPD